MTFLLSERPLGPAFRLWISTSESDMSDESVGDLCDKIRRCEKQRHITNGNSKPVSPSVVCRITRVLSSSSLASPPHTRRFALTVYFPSLGEHSTGRTRYLSLPRSNLSASSSIINNLNLISFCSLFSLLIAYSSALVRSSFSSFSCLAALSPSSSSHILNVGREELTQAHQNTRRGKSAQTRNNVSNTDGTRKT